MPHNDGMKLGVIASSLGCVLHGDPNIEVTGLAGMEHAGPSELTFLANSKYTHKVQHTRAAAILVAESGGQRQTSGAPSCRSM